MPSLNAIALAGVLCCCALGPPAYAQQQQPEPPPLRSVMLRSIVLRPVSAPPLRFATAEARPADRWIAMDKAKHAGGSFLVVLGGQYVFETKAGLGRDSGLALALGSGAAIGLTKELYDWRLAPSRHFSTKDLVADALGLALAAGLVLL